MYFHLLHRRLYWNKIRSKGPEIILLGATAFLQFFRLGIGEIQSWDESLYLVRAEACVKFGAWFDQTQYAIGGLYSSTHPPLVIWMMAFTRMILGNGVFVSRLISAFAGVFALYFFYKLAGRFFSRWVRLFATVLLGVAQGFLWYSHHAQLDIPMFAFIVGATYYAVLAFETSNTKSAVISGVLYGCALLTKAFQPLYLIPFLLILPYILGSKKEYKKLVILVVTAFIIAAPWYIFMMIIHPDYNSAYAGLVQSMKTGTYLRVSTKQWWYYINQIIIEFPFLILLPLIIPSLIRNWRSRDTVFARLSLMSIIWLIGMIGFVSLFQTRMPHFVLFMLLPATLVICVCIEEILNSPQKKRNILLSIILLIPAIIWSGNEYSRKSLREHFSFSLNADVVSLLLIVILSLIATAILYRYFSSSRSTVVFLVATIVLFFINFFRFADRKDEIFIDGAKQVTDSLMNLPNIHSLSVYEDGTTLESFLPQFNYYSDGWLLGWDNNRWGSIIPWTKIDSLKRVDSFPLTDASILYISRDVISKPKPEELALISGTDQFLRSKYRKCFYSKKYRLYWGPI